MFGIEHHRGHARRARRLLAGLGSLLSGYMAWRIGKQADLKLAAWIAAGSLLAAGSGYLASTALQPGGAGTDPDSDS